MVRSRFNVFYQIRKFYVTFDNKKPYPHGSRLWNRWPASPSLSSIYNRRPFPFSFHLTDQHTSARKRHLFPKIYPFEPLSFPNVFRAVSIQSDAESEPPQERENPAFCQGQEQEEAQGKPQATHPQKQWAEPAGDHREDQRDPARLVWLLPACEPGGAWRNRRMDAGKTAFDHQETAWWKRPGDVAWTTSAGATATLPSWASSASKKPKARNSPVSGLEQSADWRAGCGNPASPVREGERFQPAPTSSPERNSASLALAGHHAG